jgi:hypothetical protein
MKIKQLLTVTNSILKNDLLFYQAFKLDLVDYTVIIDEVYKKYGFGENAYNEFRAPADTSDKPLAWYRTQYNQPNEYLTPPSKVHSGFIPDAINDVILDEKISVNKKLALLNRMFSDLKKIKKGKKNA